MARGRKRKGAEFVAKEWIEPRAKVRHPVHPVHQAHHAHVPHRQVQDLPPVQANGIRRDIVDIPGDDHLGNGNPPVIVDIPANDHLANGIRQDIVDRPADDHLANGIRQDIPRDEVII